MTIFDSIYAIADLEHSAQDRISKAMAELGVCSPQDEISKAMASLGLYTFPITPKEPAVMAPKPQIVTPEEPAVVAPEPQIVTPYAPQIVTADNPEIDVIQYLLKSENTSETLRQVLMAYLDEPQMLMAFLAKPQGRKLPTNKQEEYELRLARGYANARSKKDYARVVGHATSYLRQLVRKWKERGVL